MCHYGQILVMSHDKGTDFGVSICVNDLNGHRLPSSFLIQINRDGLNRWSGISNDLGVDLEDTTSRLIITGIDEVGE